MWHVSVALMLLYEIANLPASSLEYTVGAAGCVYVDLLYRVQRALCMYVYVL